MSTARTAEDMGAFDATRQKQLVDAVQQVTKRIADANAAATSSKNVRLVLVSKLKPHTDILALHKHDPSYEHFGENYVQELQQKAAVLPKTIKWHFIGGLQSNKCKPLTTDVPGIWCVSSVDTAKKADGLEKGRAAASERLAQAGERLDRLRVHVQVNTSGEESKSGVEPGQATTELCKHIVEKCSHLQLIGFMTIGAIARSRATTAETENEDFVKLRETRAAIAKELDMQESDLELSMGMSNDFEGAIKQGSDEVRIGSTIFGARPPKGDAQVKSQAESGGS